MKRETREKQGLVLEAVASGMSRMGAAADAGIARSTMYRWIDAEPAFRKRLADAEGRFERRVVRVMDGAANRGSWAAMAWLAERRLPDRFKTRTALELSGSVGVEDRHVRMVAEIERLTDEELDARIRGEFSSRLRELVGQADSELLVELGVLGFEPVGELPHRLLHAHR